MKHEKMINLIKSVLNEYFKSQDMEIKANEKTVLFGKDSELDSIGLVNVIIDIESKFSDEDIEISLMSEKAMSRRNSPFKTISTLAEFIDEQITEEEYINE